MLFKFPFTVLVKICFDSIKFKHHFYIFRALFKLEEKMYANVSAFLFAGVVSSSVVGVSEGNCTPLEVQNWKLGNEC